MSVLFPCLPAALLTPPLQFAGLALCPFVGLVLADWGADVVHVDRPHARSADTLARGKRSVVLDIKTSRADVLIDPLRPGVLERLAMGPEVFLGEDGVNKRQVYGRLAGDMTGYDINYLALSGVFSLSGAHYLFTYPLGYALSGASSPFGRLSACSLAAGTPTAPQRIAHTLNGGRTFYAVYGCRDMGFVADSEACSSKRDDRGANDLADSDACVIPVLSPAEAAALVQEDGALLRVHPVLSRTTSRVALEEVQAEGYVAPGAHTVDVLVVLLGMSEGSLMLTLGSVRSSG
ncbi:hypothetical protein PHLGIDRAFT_508300 [Phlebiopsis gigantea 11061_1 CR5-6]|uniref:Uncharacterized protein n=1 Tax=Phlebiopsis gigantea (strain 11061_1 CR5-6) TaxID=745531 RepID=A0A0C3P9A9_PHLG1|nr:hypothetical protein PHLGIDRAFT_508300 [Phlebiopsis gigantea 11061_1 CR5-6]